MFSFLRRSSFRSQELPATIRMALVNDGLSPQTDPNALRLLERHGSYSGRRVSFFRIFDAGRATERGVHPRSFADLDAYPELVLAAGHTEHGGAIVVTPGARTEATQPPTRELADRLKHGDDDRVVFPNGTSE
jgi:hypothetical protein